MYTHSYIYIYIHIYIHIYINNIDYNYKIRSTNSLISIKIINPLLLNIA